jgi:glycosyltransferase involved in cell wall biosynthesis
MSYGLPVITTSTGAAGFGLRDGREAIIADTPTEFATAVIRVYRDRDLWQQLSDNGYDHIRQHFTPQVIEKIINNSIREISKPHATERIRNYPG